MKNIPEKKKRSSVAPRNSTEAAITCRSFTRSGAMHMSDGVMRNFPSDWSYAETSHEFNPGTILIVRMRLDLLPASTLNEDVQPHTICLAEVKWRQEMVIENTSQHGLGLRYLD